MSVKQADAVHSYISNVIDIRNVLENLMEWVDSLPAPDENGEITIPNLHYGHIGTVSHVKNLLGQVSQATDGFYE